MFVLYRWFIFVIWMMLILSGCGDPESQGENDRRLTEQELENLQKPLVDDNTFRFGFDLRTSPQEDARQYLPFLSYLERTTGFHFKLHFTASGNNIVNDLGTGKIHFAAIGAVSLIQAQQRYNNVVSLVRGLNSQGDTGNS